ncbi:MAG TPA: succinylglutamate desuccinylase/aspartoacylase family protein [Patescibacteria group bacterium]|nr:succinylglutamate desuccinylase/aspartoacylase family protein [Patescibacteria group bacterium]
MKIQFVTGLHGNERLPVLALASLGQNQIIANPKALSKNVRFTEKDMNASFGTNGRSYEEKRAKDVLDLINPNYRVIDLHTFSAESDPFVIIVDLKMLNFAKRLGFKNIVFMKHNIKGGRALINHRNGVSIEMGNHNDPKSFARTVDLASRIKRGKNLFIKTKVYEVFGIIDKPGKYFNFKKYKNEFTPILSGENAYDFYGLKARIIRI